MVTLEFCDKHNMVAYLVKSKGSEGFHEIIDFLTSSHIYYALTECPTLYISLIEQFWQTAALSTTKDEVYAITATIDGRDKIITEASIRRHLKLQDSEGLTSLPNAEIFEQLTSMGTPTTPPSIQITHAAEETATIPYDSPLLGGHTPRSDEGRLKHTKLMELVTKLTDRVMAVEKDLQHTKKTYSTALTKLVLKVKKLEKQFRKIAQIDIDPTISLVHDEGTSWFQEDIETQEKNNADNEEISTVGAEVSTASHDVSTAAAALVYIRRSASKAKDKGKEEQAKAMAEQEQERINFKAVLELQRKLNEREENRPYFVAKVRKNMVMYLKNQAGYKQNYFKGMKYEEIRLIFEKVWDQTHTFVPMDSEDKEKGTEKKSGGTRKKTLAKKRADDEEFVNPEILSTKYPIVDWEYQLLGQLGGKDFEVYKLTRADGSASYHGNIQAFLGRLNREDLRDLRMIFDPDEKDDIWMNQLDWKLLKWKLHENCGVHTLFMDGTLMQINMLVEKKYPLIKDLLEKMLNLQLEAEEESTMAFELLKFIKFQIEEQ
ncbi:hypothetical protein Tco_0782858 [Tanacetum coccineum]